MRVANVNGLVTLFYDGSELYNGELHDKWLAKWKEHDFNEEGWEEWNLSDECKQYWRERQSWQQVVIEEGVTKIPCFAFGISCKNIKRVIMADTVIRIKSSAFRWCRNLTYIKWSINVEVIEDGAFLECGLVSVFIPPRCTTIGSRAFRDNDDLEIFHVHPNVQLGRQLLSNTKLLRDSRFELDGWGNYDLHEVHNWIKNINNDEKYSLHRACCSFQPLKEVIYTIILQQGIGAFNIKNDSGITPSRYLKENPYADIKEMDIIRSYVMKMMGEYE